LSNPSRTFTPVSEILIPQGATPINHQVGVFNDLGDWIYLLGMYPIYRHRDGDQRGFRVTIAQLIDSSACSPTEIRTAFGISKSCMDRTLRKYRAGGITSFYDKKPRQRRSPVITPEVTARALQLLDEGYSKSAVAEELAINLDTLRRAVWDGRLCETKNTATTACAAGTDKTHRNIEDALASEGLGTGCTRSGERMLASLGLIDEAATRFEHVRHVPFGGVICAVGALLENGLFDAVSEHLGKIKGYYGVSHILLPLAFMNLCRIKTTEQLRGKAPGEFGKLRSASTASRKCAACAKSSGAMSRDGASEKWAAALSRQWMAVDPEAVGTLYIDGHVRVYHGSKTKLPRKYVSRQRLCLRGTTDYWVNDLTSKPCFVIDKVVASGLIDALREDIVPRLLREVPGQPTADQLKDDPWLCRFTLVLDREGYSPGFFKEMWQNHRIACITYHKHPDGQWPQEEFAPHDVHLSNGEIPTLLLAQRGSWVGTGTDALWLKEVRKLTSSGHQVSLIGTAYRMEPDQMAGGLFSRWCQENYFRYAMQHFAIDLLGEYKTEPLHDTTRVINPAWRELERTRNALESKLRYRRARFAEYSLHPLPVDDAKKHARRERQQAELLEEILAREAELAEIKEHKKQTPHYINWADLSEAERFEQPMLGRKRLMDAVRMIAYRAETALCGLLRSPVIDTTAARRLLQDLFVTEADIRPDAASGQLHIEVH
jgi:transposase